MSVSTAKVQATAAVLTSALEQLIIENSCTETLMALVQGVFLWRLGLTYLSPAELINWGGPFCKPAWVSGCPVAITALYAKLQNIGPSTSELGMALEEFYWRSKTSTERDQGVYYTHPLLARVMARLGLNLYLRERMRPRSAGNRHKDRLRLPASFVLLDPAVGAGAFLVAAFHELVSLPSDLRPEGTKRALLPFLAGRDIDAGAVDLTKARLWLEVVEEVQAGDRLFPALPNIVTGNSLQEPPLLADMVLANPPYQRQETMEPGLKSFLVNRFQGLIPKQADLYTYFLANLTHMLKPGGAAAVVTPTAWLEVDYGRALQKLLQQSLEIPLIMGSACERWFEEAAVHTVVTTLVRRTDKRKPRRPTTMVNLMQPLAAVQPEEIAMLAEMPPGFKHDLNWQAVTLPQKRLQALTQREEPVRAAWGTLLRAPAVYFNLHDKTSKRWIPAGQVGEVRRGFTTGANAFFFVQDITAGALPDLRRKLGITADSGLAIIAARAGKKEVYFAVEERFLLPLIKTPREVDGYLIREERLRSRVLMLPPDEDYIKGLKVADYIRWGEQQGYQQRPTLKARPLWWSLPRLLPAQVLARQFYDMRFNFPYNPGAILCDHTFYYLTGCLDPELVASILNSTITFLHVELWGRSNMGDGVLTFYGPELTDLPLVKPTLFSREQQQALKTAFRRLCGRAVLPIQQELGQKDRQELDLIVLSALGLTGLTAASLLGEIYTALYQLVNQRQKRSQ
ncbi:MAG: Eco57I restriction-modification methylase domain-containing protein [bacterium]|jgi:hypothetical protein